jgi:hypothetical protein
MSGYPAQNLDEICTEVLTSKWGLLPSEEVAAASHYIGNLVVEYKPQGGMLGRHIRQARGLRQRSFRRRATSFRRCSTRSLNWAMAV